MTKSNRDAAISETLRWEGGYTNDAADPGGPTNWGITIADARKYWKKGATAADVKAMPKNVAINIYATKYWKTPYYDCDTLASGLDLSVFDFGVNSGPSRAKRYLTQSSGGSTESTIIKLNDARLAFLKGLGTWPNFGKGWGRRVAGIKAKSLEMYHAPAVKPAHAGILAVLATAAYGVYHFIGSHPIATGMTVGALILVTLGVVAYIKKNS